jgi:competence protein ComGC
MQYKISKMNSFTLVEVIMTIFIVSLTLATTVSMMTKMNHKSVGIGSNVLNCIQSGVAGITFDAATGNITGLPTSGSCYAAYYGCSKNITDDCNTLFNYADSRGTADQTISALKILRASCDNGGTRACSYFNTRCYSNEAKCYSPDPKYTLRYYLNMTATTANLGRSYVETKGIDYYKWNMSTYNNEVDTVCPTCPGSSTACAIKCAEVAEAPTCDGTLIGSLCVASADESCPNVGNGANYFYMDDAIAKCSSRGAGWRLPTKTELNTIYNNKGSLSGFYTGDGHWTSTYYSTYYVWLQDLGNGDQYYEDIRLDILFYVRCVK